MKIDDDLSDFSPMLMVYVIAGCLLAIVAIIYIAEFT